MAHVQQGVQRDASVLLKAGKQSRVERVASKTESGAEEATVVKTYCADYLGKEMAKRRCSSMELMDTKMRLMRALQHRNIVEITKMDEVNAPSGKPEWRMTMEDGGEALKIKQYPVDVVRSWLVCLSSALLYLHETLKVCHCDIKPENILLKDGIIRICDMDSAFFFTGNNDTHSGWQITPAFTPPELCHALMLTKSVSPPVRGRPLDMWCLGVTLYCLLYGTTPFNPQLNIVKLYEFIINQDVSFGAVLKGGKQVRLSADLERILRGLLVKDPAKRFDIRQLRACLIHEAIYE